jgi:hypothetical protein
MDAKYMNYKDIIQHNDKDFCIIILNETYTLNLEKINFEFGCIEELIII